MTKTNVLRWLRAFVLFACMVFLAMWVSFAFASGGSEIEVAIEKFEGWSQTNMAKLFAFIALAVGAIVATIRRD